MLTVVVWVVKVVTKVVTLEVEEYVSVVDTSSGTTVEVEEITLVLVVFCQ